MKSLVVDGLVEVLDEDVAGTSLSEGWITLGPHDSAWLALDQRVVELVEGSFGCKPGSRHGKLLEGSSVGLDGDRRDSREVEEVNGGRKHAIASAYVRTEITERSGKRPLTILAIQVVNISITKGSSRYSVSANSD